MITSKRVKKEVYDTVYVTDDGQEFSSRREAQKHEDSLLAERGIHSEYLGFMHTFDTYITCYEIKSEEDLKYLEAKEWNHNCTYTYDGPGWYIEKKIDGGDYADSYEIIKVDDYIEELEIDLKQLKDLTNS